MSAAFLIAATAGCLLAACTVDSPTYTGNLPVVTPDMEVVVTLPDLALVRPSCTDGARNGDETDIDCGGSICMPCQTGRLCKDPRDCQSRLCDSATDSCVSCNDNLKDGSESDVDCGGPDCSACGTGMACQLDSDCTSFGCVDAMCTHPVSCARIKAAYPGVSDGQFLIDPDGPGGIAPFTVWCDMTTDKGGWTVLPLAFGNSALWTISQTGLACSSVPKVDKNGYLNTFQNGSAWGWAYTSIKFNPPIPVKQVWLRNLIHSTATSCNNMDLLNNQTPASTMDAAAESWYFAGEDPMVPLGYTFAAGCNSPHYNASGNECSMDTIDTTTTIDRKLQLYKPAARFNMVTVEGCQSSICDVNTGQAERFNISHPSQNGLWKDGILVR